MIRFIVELFDTSGQALEPGLGGQQLDYEYPVPVPQVGDTVVLMTNTWRVESREFQFHRKDDGNVSKVTLICSKVH